MVTLADAAALVPYKEPEPEDDLLGRGLELARMKLSDLLDILVVPRQEERDTLEWTFESIGRHYGQRKEDKAFFDAIGRATIEEAEDDEAVEERAAKQRKQGSSFLSKVARWLFKRIMKWGLKQVLKLALRAIRWVIKEVVVRAVEMVIDWTVRPILTGILEFIGVNPELWPFVAVIGGLAALGYVIWDKFFNVSGAAVPEPVTPPTTAAATTAVTGQRIVAGQRTVAAPAIPAGAAVAAGAPSSLAALIARGEGSYNSVNLGAAHGYKASTVDLENMTVAEVQKHQRDHDFNAAGRYQIIGSTLDQAARALHLSGYEKFDRALQDRIFNEFLIGQKRHAIADYISGRSDNINAAILAASQEWASVAAPVGARLQGGGVGDGLTSFYAGTANNKASISAAEMTAILNKERASHSSSTQIADSATQARAPVMQTPTNATGSRLGQPVAQTPTMTQPNAPMTVIKDKKGALIAVNA